MELLPEPPKTNPTNETQEQVKPTKEKKPRSEAQQAATAKALAAMTAARKERAKKQIEKKEEVKKAVAHAKKVVEEKIIKEDVGFVMRNDFETKISSLTKEIGELRGLLSASQQKQVEKATPAVKQERIVERVIERVPTPQTTQQAKLTGNALLDRLFFDK